MRQKEEKKLEDRRPETEEKGPFRLAFVLAANFFIFDFKYLSEVTKNKGTADANYILIEFL
jgi:hypothetical protein